jgi:hypothetical protein
VLLAGAGDHGDVGLGRFVLAQHQRALGAHAEPVSRKELDQPGHDPGDEGAVHRALGGRGHDLAVDELDTLVGSEDADIGLLARRTGLREDLPL